VILRILNKIKGEWSYKIDIEILDPFITEYKTCQYVNTTTEDLDSYVDVKTIHE